LKDKIEKKNKNDSIKRKKLEDGIWKKKKGKKGIDHVDQP
jgi:hypothetical protein